MRGLRFSLWPRRLVVRLYIFSIALIVFSFLVFVIVLPFTTPLPQRYVARYITCRFAEIMNDREALHIEVQRLKDILKQELALYDLDNNLIAASMTHPPPPLNMDEKRDLFHDKIFIRGDFPPTVVMGIIDNNNIIAYGLFPFPPSPFGFHLLVVSGVILICIAVFSILFARSLAKPIARLSATAQAFGQGNFDIRTGIHRQDELGHFAKAFDEMAGRLTYLIRSQKELLANVSHEFRTPLSRMQVALDIAMERDPEMLKQEFAGILEDIKELERLVEDVIMASRLDLSAGQNKYIGLLLRMEQTDVKKLLNKAADRFRASYPTHHLKVLIDGELHAVMADQVLLRRVLDNLIDNARKYSPDGSTITVHARDDGPKLYMEVSDQGMGIADGEKENVFKPFYRTDRSRSRSTGGVGLGLTLSLHIIKAHNGSIEIESDPGGGTTVRFTLPHHNLHPVYTGQNFDNL